MRNKLLFTEDSFLTKSFRFLFMLLISAITDALYTFGKLMFFGELQKFQDNIKASSKGFG